MRHYILAALLMFVPVVVNATDDHTTKEVENLLGPPHMVQHTTCGGGVDYNGDPLAKWSCIVWGYEADGMTYIMAFQAKNKRLSSIRVLSNGQLQGPKASENVLMFLHKKLHDQRS